MQHKVLTWNFNGRGGKNAHQMHLVGRLVDRQVIEKQHRYKHNSETNAKKRERKVNRKLPEGEKDAVCQVRRLLFATPCSCFCFLFIMLRISRGKRVEGEGEKSKKDG